MTTPSTPSPPVADAERSHAPENDAAAVHPAPQPIAVAAKGGRRLGREYWLEYTITGSTIAMTTGLIMFLFWSGTQNSLPLLLAAFVLFLVGFLGWWGMFLFQTWQLARWFVPPLVGRLRKGVRNLFPNSAPNVEEK